jgi:xanthine dehydrogenase accessory factor
MKEFQFALENLKSGEPIILATIIRQSGSSPRGKGARMVLNRSGQLAGSIGGGQLEENIKKSFESILTTKKASVSTFTLSESEAESLEMICGGSVSILVEPILPEQTDLISMFQAIVEAMQAQRHGWLISQLPVKDQPQAIKHGFISSKGVVSGNLTLDFQIESGFLRNIKIDDQDSNWVNFENGLRSPQEINSNLGAYFVEPVGKLCSCYIIGAGHIASKLAPLTRLVGFSTIVLDDRPDYVSLERFPSADNRIVVDDFQNVIGQILVEPDSFIVIVTRGHNSDRDVLGQALNTPAAYIGMIGSRRKIALTFEALQKQGFSKEALQKVHTPIGLSIGAETPEEIAVSIVAEMIQVRAKLR